MQVQIRHAGGGRFGAVSAAMIRIPFVLLAVACCSPTAGAAWAPEEPADPTSTEDTIEVIANSPLGPQTADLQRAPANVQRLGADQLEAPGTRTVADALQGLGDVFRSDATGSAFQPDLFYRGYTVSPLLGLPQGMSVYQDGVRVNELFGDVVNLDLVPLVALRDVELVPGSNPVFGRNTLGGALVLHTKTGFDSSGLELEGAGGSHARYEGSAEYGVAGERWALYAAAEHQQEDGWREHSDSRVERGFVKGSWRPDAATSVDLSLSGADNRLRGNGAAPVRLLKDEGRGAVFTYPDETRPRLLLTDVLAGRAFADGSRLSANLYYRRSRSHSFNGDGTEFEACAEPGNAGLLCETGDGGENVVVDADGNPVEATGDDASATQNRSRTSQSGYGGAVQWERDLGSHHVTVGGSADGGRIVFHSSTELGRLTDDRGTVGSGILVGDAFVDLVARNDSYGAFLLDTWTPLPVLQFTGAVRWNRTRIGLHDLGEEGDLTGEHHFSHVNPMLGASWQFADGWTVFGSVAQSTRAPTPVELTCANPDDPCKLPNGFVDDPPLDEVVTRTIEWGVRQRSTRWSGSLSLFHALSHDDILFITDGDLTNEGYFSDVGDTLRQGVELSLQSNLGAGFTASMQVAGLIAEFRESFLENSPNHPLRDAGDPELPDPRTQEVHRGDRIPLIPRVQARGTIDWTGGAFSAGVEVVGRGNSRFRGDESNTDPRRLGGFAIVNVHAEWDVRPNVTLFAGVDNLFDRRFETFGVYGEAGEVLGDDYENERRFVGPGAPILAEAGVRLRFF